MSIVVLGVSGGLKADENNRSSTEIKAKFLTTFT